MNSPSDPPKLRPVSPALDPVWERLLEEGLRETGGQTPTLREWLETAEAWWICRALSECRGNRSAAARLLGIGRRTLYAKLERYGIQPEWRYDSWPSRRPGLSA